jgi:ParB family chromosome partitioning protein
MRYQVIHSNLLEPDPHQPRRSMDDIPLQELQESVRVHGILQPLIVYENGKRHTIADGHRRFEVCHLLDIKEIPVLVLPAKPDAETLLLMQLAANGMRENLKPSERAFAYRRLKDMRGLSHGDMASLMNVSMSVVTETLSYLDLPPEALALLDSGQLAGSTAYAISRAKDDATRKEMLDKALRGELKRDDALRRVNRRGTTKPTGHTASFRLPSAKITIDLENEPEIPVVMELLRELVRECRQAEKQGLNVKTLERVLMDRSQNDPRRKRFKGSTESLLVQAGGEG